MNEDLLSRLPLLLRGMGFPRIILLKGLLHLHRKVRLIVKLLRTWNTATLSLVLSMWIDLQSLKIFHSINLGINRVLRKRWSGALKIWLCSTITLLVRLVALLSLLTTGSIFYGRSSSKVGHFGNTAWIRSSCKWFSWSKLDASNTLAGCKTLLQAVDHALRSCKFIILWRLLSKLVNLLNHLLAVVLGKSSHLL